MTGWYADERSADNFDYPQPAFAPFRRIPNLMTGTAMVSPAYSVASGPLSLGGGRKQPLL
jgi:hypothetical protein